MYSKSADRNKVDAFFIFNYTLSATSIVPSQSLLC